MLSGAKLFDSRPRRADRGSGSKYRRAVGSCGRRRYIGMVQEREGTPKRTFITHGELKAASALQNRITKELRWNSVVPERGQEATLT